MPLIAKADATMSGDICGGEVPIACTLGAGKMSARLDEWNALLADKRDLLRGVTVRHALDDGLRVEFGPDTDVTEIARLAATGIASVLGAGVFGDVGLTVVLAIAAVLHRRRRQQERCASVAADSVPVEAPQLTTRR